MNFTKIFRFRSFSPPVSPYKVTVRRYSKFSKLGAGWDMPNARRAASLATIIAGVAGVGSIAYINRDRLLQPPFPSTDQDTQTRFTTRISSNGAPYIDPEAGYPFGYLRPPSPEQVTKILNSHTWSATKGCVKGVSGYDGSQVASNGECEDRYIHGKFPSPLWQQTGKHWMAWGVFDGHCGPLTAEALTQTLLPYVYHRVKSVGREVLSTNAAMSDERIQRAIQGAFEKLDDVFVKKGQEIIDSDLPFNEKVTRLQTASNGSCALLSLFDPDSRKLHVACTGDSRAVLGREMSDGNWETVPLSVDQGGRNEAEQERIRKAHPEEEDGIVQKGRVLGLATARAFGDAHWKWTSEMQLDARQRFLTDYLSPYDATKYKTPPYITAKPEVTTTELKSGQRAFMIMASDGLWDTMSSEQAVDLVGRWVAWKDKGSKEPILPEKKDFGKFDWSPFYRSGWKLAPEGITVQDNKASVHLTRNALGGGNQSLISGLLAFRPPYSRYSRDDITVQVVFFN